MPKARPLRVSFVVDSGSWGGAEVWVGHHVRRAAAHGAVASVVAAEPVADRFRALITADRVAEVPVLRYATESAEVAAALAKQDADVVHVNLVDPASNAAAVRAAIAAAPTLATLHLAGDTSAGPGRAALADLYARLELLTTPSHDAAEQVRAELAEPRQGIVVTRNGVDIPSAPHGPAGNAVPRVGVHCRLTAQKGVDVLVQASGLLVRRGVTLEVVVAGSGRDAQELRRQAAGLPVRFVGWVAEPRDFLRGLDVFCLPSRHEAMPLSLLEAMAEGLPCVATDVGDVGAVIGPAVALVPPDDAAALADALAVVLTDPHASARLAARGRAFAERHLDADPMAAVTFRLLAKAASLHART